MQKGEGGRGQLGESAPLPARRALACSPRPARAGSACASARGRRVSLRSVAAGVSWGALPFAAPFPLRLSECLRVSESDIQLSEFRNVNFVVAVYVTPL